MTLALAVSSCGEDKTVLLKEACNYVAEAEEISRQIRVEVDRPTYKEREEAWKAAADNFSSLAEDFPEYLKYSVTVRSIHLYFRDTFSDSPSAEDVNRVSGLCGVNIVWSD